MTYAQTSPAPAATGAHSIWWIDPARCLAFLILPIYVVSALLGGPIMSEFGSANFLTPAAILIGAGGIMAMALGCVAGQGTARRQGLPTRTIDPVMFDRALVTLAVIAIAAHLLLLGNVARDPAAMIAAIKGEAGAIFQVKEQVVKMVGVTSLVNVTPLVVAMASYRGLAQGRMMPGRTGWIFWLLVAMIAARGFVAMERLAIVEAAIAWFVPWFTFRARRVKGAGLFPLLGIGAVFALFALGEYMRSWAFYVDRYDNFLQFASLRLLGYISVASNTAAGVWEKIGALGQPYLTATFLDRLGLVDFGAVSPLERFFASYGNEEYNNPGGAMAAVIDFGIAGGLVWYAAIGTVLGWLHGRFRMGDPAGLLGYPLAFPGIAILTQLIYWGDPRFVTAVAATVLTLLVVTRPAGRINAMPNARLATPLSAG